MELENRRVWRGTSKLGGLRGEAQMKFARVCRSVRRVSRQECIHSTCFIHAKSVSVIASERGIMKGKSCESCENSS